jgi:hypothetical protein
MSDIKALLAHQKNDMSDIKALLAHQKDLFPPFQPPSAPVPDQPPALQVQSVISMLATGESEIFGQASKFQAAPAALFHFPASHAVMSLHHTQNSWQRVFEPKDARPLSRQST